MATHIQRMQESCPPLFSDELYGLNAQSIACMFLRGIPTQWCEEVDEPPMYRWNKFRICLETIFMSSVGCW